MTRPARRILRALKAIRINALDPLDWLQQQERYANEATRRLRAGETCPYTSSEVHDRITGEYRQGGIRRDRT